MNTQAQVNPLFRLITLTRTSLFMTNPIAYVDMETKIFLSMIKKELTYNSSGNQKLLHYIFF